MAKTNKKFKLEIQQTKKRKSYQKTTNTQKGNRTLKQLSYIAVIILPIIEIINLIIQIFT